MMNITEKYTFTSSENQNVEEVIKLDRHLIDIENVMVESLEAFTKRGKDVRVIVRKMKVSLILLSITSH